MYDYGTYLDLRVSGVLSPASDLLDDTQHSKEVVTVTEQDTNHHGDHAIRSSEEVMAVKVTITNVHMYY